MYLKYAPDFQRPKVLIWSSGTPSIAQVVAMSILNEWEVNCAPLTLKTTMLCFNTDENWYRVSGLESKWKNTGPLPVGCPFKYLIKFAKGQLPFSALAEMLIEVSTCTNFICFLRKLEKKLIDSKIIWRFQFLPCEFDHPWGLPLILQL